MGWFPSMKASTKKLIVNQNSLFSFFSAGVGRTGVFLAIDMILTKFDKGVINSIDVFGEVCAMRERRMNMVQTLV